MKEQRRRTTADGSANSCAVVVRRWSVVCRASAVIPATSGRPESDGARAFLAPSALFGAAWAARRKASPPLALIHIFLNSKFRIQNLKFKIPPAFLRPSLRVSSPFGLSEGPSFNDAWRHQYAHQLKTLNSKPWLAPLSLVTPAASDQLQRRSDEVRK
jgi:hypothetical protein